MSQKNQKTNASTIIIPDDCLLYSANQLSVPKHHINYIEGIMISQGLILDRIDKLAQEIHRDYQGEELHIMGVLKGGESIFADLKKTLNILNSNGNSSIPITYDFIRTSSYINSSANGTVNIEDIKNKLKELKGKNILLVEDIIDTGNTMLKLTSLIKEHHPKSLRVLALLSKRLPEQSKFTADYIGFSIPNKFVVGYCLDFNEHFRDLQHICVINADGINKYRK